MSDEFTTALAACRRLKKESSGARALEGAGDLRRAPPSSVVGGGQVQPSDRFDLGKVTPSGASTCSVTTDSASQGV